MDYGNITLFETSWEVCNKVGGIYAVVSSKALQAIENFGENYWLLGPDLGNNPDFEEDSDPVIETVGKILKAYNLKCRLGHWNIPGKPKVILVNFRNRYDQNQLLYEYWKEYQVDSMSGGWDYIEPVMFATACGEVIATIYQHMLEPIGCPAIAQFHEWMCGAGLLYLKRHCPPVGTVFTTHATMLGRSLSGNGRDLYSCWTDQIRSRAGAASYGVTAKHSMECVSAREADCFTTVSDITAEEASVVLGRKPDIVTPNGLDLRVIPDFSTDRERPEAYRAAILQSAGRLLRRELPEDTRIVLISGRYEFRNKGVDVFLEALAKVKHDLASTSTHVLALCCVMGGYTGVNDDAVSGDPPASRRTAPTGCARTTCTTPPATRSSRLPPARPGQHARQPRVRDLQSRPAQRPRRLPQPALRRGAGGLRPRRLPLLVRALGLHARGKRGLCRAHGDERSRRLRPLGPFPEQGKLRARRFRPAAPSSG